QNSTHLLTVLYMPRLWAICSHLLQKASNWRNFGRVRLAFLRAKGGTMAKKNLAAYLKNSVAITAGMVAYSAAMPVAHADANWNAPYVGGGVGTTWLQNDATNVKQICNVIGFDVTCPGPTTSGFDASFSGYAGYMMPLPMSNFVWGVEGDFDWL